MKSSAHFAAAYFLLPTLALLAACAEPVPRQATESPAFCQAANKTALPILTGNEFSRDITVAAFENLVACGKGCKASPPINQNCNQATADISSSIDRIYRDHKNALAVGQNTPGYALRKLRRLAGDLTPLYLNIEQTQGRATEGTREIDEIRQTANEARRRIPSLETAAAEAAKQYEHEARAAIRNNNLARAQEFLLKMFQNDPEAQANQTIKQELIAATEAEIRLYNELMDKTISEFARLAMKANPSAGEKKRAEQLIREANQNIRVGLAAAPGNEKLIQLSASIQKLANKETLARLGSKEKVEEPEEAATLKPPQLIAKAQDSLGVGKFNEAAEYAEKVVSSRSAAGLDLHAQAHIILGIRHAMSGDGKTTNEAARQTSLAKSEFVAAIQMSRSAKLPAGFAKFQVLFEEARKSA